MGQVNPRLHEPAAPHPVAPQNPNEFDRGVRHGIDLAMQQQDRMMAEARRNALVAAQSEPHLIMARKGGFDQGFAAGMQAAQKSAAGKDSQFTYADMEKARRRGFEEGKAASKGNGIPNVDEASMRKKMVDEMLESCRVIAESNPNMAPGVNAVRHKIKKLA